MDTPSHYLVATAGYPNFGDEFITASWLRFLAETAPDTDVWLDCPQPGVAQLLFEDLHPRLRITNTLWRAIWEAGDIAPSEVSKRVVELIHNLGSPNYDLGLVKLRTAKSLHLLGGGYVNGIWPHHAALVNGMKAVKEITGAQLFATGQGLMPLVGTSSEVLELFDGFDHVSVRDAESARAYSLQLGIDDAFLGAAAETAKALRGPAAMFVCIQSDMNDEGRFSDIVAAARVHIRAAVDQGKKVYYLEAIPGIDRPAYDLLSDLIPEEDFLPFTRVWEEGLPLGGNHVWITTRFHFHLLASAAGARGIAYGVKQGYYDIKHTSLISLGSGWALDTPDAPVNKIPPGVEALRTKLEKLTDQKRAEAVKLYPRSGRAEDPQAKGSSLNALRRLVPSLVSR